MRIWALVVVLLLIAFMSYCVTAQAAVYDIPAGYANETLIEWNTVSGIDILYDYYLIMGLQTNRVRGDMDALEALEEMLRDTGWMFDAVTDTAIAVVPGAKPLGTCKPWLGAKAPLPPCKQAT